MLRMTDETEERAARLVLAAGDLGEAVRVGSRRNRKHFTPAEIRRVAQRARRVAADCICLSRMLDRAAESGGVVAEAESAHAAREIAHQDAAHPGT